MGLIQFIDYVLNYNSEVRVKTSLNLTLQQSQKELENCKANELELLQQRQDYFIQLQKLKETVDPKLKAWDDKYPVSDIEYQGRYLFDTKKIVPIDVRLLITPQDFHIKNYLNEWGLNWDGKQPINEFIPLLYAKIQQSFYLYETDFQRYGLSEFWEFPYEVLDSLNNLGKGAFDCESWAHLQASFYIASGIPKERVRVVVGLTSQNVGHSTVYVLNDAFTKWRHLNSTTDYFEFKNKKNLDDFPSTDDAYSGKDIIGIQKVWFSFRNDKAWSVFKTDAIEESFKNEGNNLFRIFRM